MPNLIAALMRPERPFALVLVLLTLGTAGQVQAANERRAACTSDVFRLCNTEVPRVDHMISCLKKSQSNLSPGCRATVEGKK